MLSAGCCSPNEGVLTPATLVNPGPVAGSTTACPNASVYVSFSQAMNPDSINANTFTLAGPGGVAVRAAVSYNTATNQATLTPNAVLGSGVAYTATISAGAMNLYGIPITAFSWSFTTASNGCHAPPSVISVTPVAGSTTACPNAAVTATFSEAMNVATVNASTFTLAPGVVGTVTHDVTNKIFTLTPSSSLAGGTTYTATISTAAQDTYGNPLPAPYIWSFTTAANSCQPPPTVVSVTPVAGSTGNCPNKIVSATFSEAMNAATITTSTFLLTGPGSTPVTGAVSYNAATDTAIFAASSALALSTTYTATITTGAKDNFGNALAAPYVWTFTTGANTCLPAPPPISVTPPSGAAGVCPNTVITATYLQAMNPATITAASFLLNITGGAVVAGAVTHDATNKIYTFTPTAVLSLSTSYTATITTAAQDTFGNAMAANYVWSFTTGTSTCVSATPIVTGVTPLAGSVGNCTNLPVTATFNIAMNPATINTNTFTLAPATAGTVTLDGTQKVATFTPSTNLAVSTVYTATITTGAQSTGGVALAANYVWSFTTSSQACQPPVPIGTAANFVILGASTVTNTGPTVITGGNLGLSPGTSVTGFPPGIFTAPANEQITTPAAAQAEADADIAYIYAAGLPGGAALPTDLSGLTFTQGLYKNAVAVTFNSGTLTLDAQGNTNAVFIFQIGSTFTTLGSTQMVLANGAQAKNVFWQIGSSATMGTNSVFKGTVLAFQAVSMQTGANLVGRAIALNAAVTMDTNLATAP
jgi:hypothetical protein